MFPTLPLQTHFPCPITLPQEGAKGYPTARMKFFSVFVPTQIMTFLRVISRPPYISDIWVRHVCDALLSAPWSSETQYETLGRDLLSRLPGHKTHDGDILVDYSYDGEQKFFLGGPGTSSYPLHRDQNDADAIFTVFEGCKEFLLVKPSSRGFLSRFQLPGFNIWNEDLYSTGLPEGALGWRGTIYQGETLYMPGDVLHEVR